MKKLAICLTAGLLVLGASSLFAEDSTNTTSTATTETPAAHKGLTPEQRKDRATALKLIGLSQKDLKGLSREDRADKIKEAANKYLADLKAKKDAGTLTAEEKTDMELVKKLIGHHKKAAATAAN